MQDHELHRLTNFIRDQHFRSAGSIIVGFILGVFITFSLMSFSFIMGRYSNKNQSQVELKEESKNG